MTPLNGMPHPWWMFWQIGDFLVMATLVTLFVRFVLRSNRTSADADRQATDPDPAPPGAPDGSTRAASGNAAPEHAAPEQPAPEHAPEHAADHAPERSGPAD